MKYFIFNIISIFLGAPLLVVLVLFAALNHETTAFHSLFTQEPIEGPLYAPTLGALALGFLFGSLLTWAANRETTKEVQRLRRDLARLEEKVTSSGAQPHTPPAPSSKPFLLIGKKDV